MNTLPTWALLALPGLMEAAEAALPETGRGYDRAEWCADMLRGIAAGHDLPWLPDDIEARAEELLIDAAISVIHAIDFSAVGERSRARRASRRARRSDRRD